MMTQCCNQLAALFGCSVLLLAPGAVAERPTPRTNPGWVGLYTSALIGWLENENRLNSICAHTTPGSRQREQCQRDTLEPRLYETTLRSEPRASATPAGTIVIKATPGRGLRAFYRSAPGAATAQFIPDLYDFDWRYGPYFHQTFLDRRESWFLLPATPLPQPAWIDLSEFGGSANLRLLQIEDIIRTPIGDVVVLNVEVGAVTVRPEQEADMWCEEGDPPSLQPYEEIVIHTQDLYSESGHLLVDIKYTRGC